MKTSHEQAANILNKIFPNIEARSGYIGNCSLTGSYDNRSFKIFTNVDIGGIQPLSINLPAGDVSGLTIARMINTVLMANNTKTVSPAVAQMLNAVRYESY
jgi:hypothetical protein